VPRAKDNVMIYTPSHRGNSSMKVIMHNFKMWLHVQSIIQPCNKQIINSYEFKKYTIHPGVVFRKTHVLDVTDIYARDIKHGVFVGHWPRLDIGFPGMQTPSPFEHNNVDEEFLESFAERKIECTRIG